MSINPTEIIERFNAAGQGQVFAWFDGLKEPEQQNLLAEAANIDLAEIAHLNETLVQGGGGHGVDLSDLSPAPYVPLPKKGNEFKAWAKATETGEEAIRAGRVAAFTVAGGQGTRLGFDGPKGTFQVSPVRKATLFQIFAEKILAARQRYGAAIPWFIMTSTINHEATEAFFKKHKFFGLGEDTVMFFRQGLMPAVDYNGKIMLATKDSIALTPDGHGGSLRALVRSGACAKMAEAGVDIISYFQVDNPLVRCIDPAFIGFHLMGNSEMSSKMLPKAYPKEKLGHFCMQRGRQVVIEYSDMPDTLTDRRRDDGQLAFIAGSIAIHVLNRSFVERMGGNDVKTSLPFHRADKKIGTVDINGNKVKPEKPNGVKFEMFVFDALPFAESPVVIETARQDDFSPVKNAEGVDSPQSCREDQLRQYARWFKAAGSPLPCDPTGLPEFAVEVSPLFADNEEVFVQKWQALEKKPAIQPGLILK